MAFQGDSIFWVELEKIVANPFQPRREFDEAKLKELAESVRMYGILQPLTVTRKEVQNSDGSFRSEYELIAGERRLRASKLAGLSQVPVIIREGEQSEQEKLELAIIENLQREDLNSVDRALAFRQLADVFGLSHAQVAKKVGRSREYVSNSIRLLGLPDYMLESLKLGDMSEGHARTLLMLNDRPEEQDTVFREILLKKLSVREVERIARGIATEKVRKKENVDTGLLDLERQFTETLGTRVSIVKTDFGGKLTIDYFSEDDLEDILKRMRAEAVALQGDGNAAALRQLTAATGLETVSDTVDEEVVEHEIVSSAAATAEETPVIEAAEVVATPKQSFAAPSEETKTMVTDTPVANAAPEQRVSTPVVPHIPQAVAAKPPVSTPTQAAPAPSETVATQSAPAAPVRPITPVTPPPAKPAEATRDDDDSNLYSISNFSV